MADKYYRLVCFLVDICAEVLRECFVKLAKNDRGSSYTTVEAYIAFRQHDANKLLSRKKIREDQYNLLYPGHGTADENKWDVTLLVTLITELFASNLKQLEILALKNEIREIRNELQHYPNTADMSDDDFDTYWKRLDDAIMFLANNMLSLHDVVLFRDKINKAKCNNLPNIGDCLRCWYEESRKRYENRIDQLERKLSEVDSKTKETNEILRQVTVQKPGPSGDKDKRIKVADNILKRLQARFESTMNELSDDFNAPNEVAYIRTKLRECHHVVVTGSNNSRYLEIALSAITGMDYNYKRSVEMQTSSDWIHIDPDDIDLVVCRDPFGSFSYDESKSKAMADIFNSMLYSTKTSNGDKTLDIIIVTDLKILEECKFNHEHEILEEVVKVFTDTSLTQPADLTTGCSIQTRRMTSSLLALSKNLGVMTRNFLMSYKISSGQVDKEILSKAKEKLKSGKAIVLTGNKKCGKTSIAVALASDYGSSQCLLLRKPSDVDKIDFQNICLVIIDEFTGKYRYEENEVYKWYTMFDHLYNAVNFEHMKVITTCEKSTLDKCIKEIGRHAILDHVVDVSTEIIFPKQEVVENGTEKEPYPIQLNGQVSGIKRGKQTETGDSVPKRIRILGSWSVKEFSKFNIKLYSEKFLCHILGSCILPSGDILLVDCSSDKLKKLDSRYEITSVLNLPYTPRNICYIGDNVAVVSTERGLHYVDTIRMRLIRSVDTKHCSCAIACHGDRIYVRDHINDIYIYTKDGVRLLVLYTTHPKIVTYCNSIAVSDDGSKLYLPHQEKLVTIDSNNGKILFTLEHTGINKLSAVCVDDQGHVFVSTTTKTILQASADGIGEIEVIASNFYESRLFTLLFDRKKSALVVGGNSNDIDVISLEKSCVIRN